MQWTSSGVRGCYQPTLLSGFVLINLKAILRIYLLIDVCLHKSSTTGYIIIRCIQNSGNFRLFFCSTGSICKSMNNVVTRIKTPASDYNLIYLPFSISYRCTLEGSARGGVSCPLSPVNKHVLPVAGNFVFNFLTSLCIMTLSTGKLMTVVTDWARVPFFCTPRITSRGAG